MKANHVLAQSDSDERVTVAHSLEMVHDQIAWMARWTGSDGIKFERKLCILFEGMNGAKLLIGGNSADIPGSIESARRSGEMLVD